jgi:hypothetical protein
MPNTGNLFSQQLIDLFPENWIPFPEPDPVFRIAPFLQWLISLCPKTGIRIWSPESDPVFGIAIKPELKIIRLAQYYIFLVTFSTSGTQNWDIAFRIRIRFLESDPVLRTRSCFQSKLGPILRGRFYIYSQHSHLINMQFRANSHPSYPTKRQQAINYLVLR